MRIVYLHRALELKLRSVSKRLAVHSDTDPQYVQHEPWSWASFVYMSLLLTVAIAEYNGAQGQGEKDK